MSKTTGKVRRSAPGGLVDAFFDKVTVSDADPAIRRNRLTPLARARDVVMRIADLSLVGGE